MRKKKIYKISKYVLAPTAEEAIRIEKNFPVDDCWAEESDHRDYLEQMSKEQLIGYAISSRK